MPKGVEDAKPWHPRCCEVPMWADRGAKGRGCFSARFRVQGVREADCGAADKAAA